MQIVFDPNNAAFIQQTLSGSWCSKDAFYLKTAAEYFSLSDGFEKLLSLHGFSGTLYPHQESAVRRVLGEMRGRAILADEVGLGKTIEAGIILKEYLIRHLVRHVLILVPASLVTQWRDELRGKLSLKFSIARSAHEFEDQSLVIASLDTAKKEPQSSVIQDRVWDMVIVDEAHRLKSRSTLNWRFVNSLQKTYLLLLTATPIQNDLRELYNLVTLLKPGQLKTFGEFKRRYMLDKHRPKNVASLREALHEVMVRTSRKETSINFAGRNVKSWVTTPCEHERHFYDRVIGLLRIQYRSQPREKRQILPLLVVMREASSHPLAAATTIQSMFRRGTLAAVDSQDIDEILDLAGSFMPCKLRKLYEIVADRREPAIVFTQFRTTQREICKMLADRGIFTHSFHGGLTLGEKDALIRQFQQTGGVLVSTDAGGEGRNLQFCRIVINYDLPWNPMKIEQRIGRVHRLGQAHEVEIVNLVADGTIERHVLELLEKKIDMFHQVIGEIDEILAKLDGELGERLAQIALESETNDEMDHQILRLNEQLSAARSEYELMKEKNNRWLDAAADRL